MVYQGAMGNFQHRGVPAKAGIKSEVAVAGDPPGKMVPRYHKRKRVSICLLTLSFYTNPWSKST